MSIHNAESWVKCISKTMKGPWDRLMVWTNPLCLGLTIVSKNMCCCSFFFFLINSSLHSSSIYSVHACLSAWVNNHLLSARPWCLRHSMTTRELETLRWGKPNTEVVKQDVSSTNYHSVPEKKKSLLADAKLDLWLITGRNLCKTQDLQDTDSSGRNGTPTLEEEE